MKNNLATFVVVTFLVTQVGPSARAADDKALLQQVTALDDDAGAAFTEGDFGKMKKSLLKALALGKDAFAKEPIMARIYLHLGVLYTDGLDNRAVGVRYFAKALEIRPDIEVRSNMATRTVMSAFAEAGHQEKSQSAPRPPPPPAKAAAASSERCHGDGEVANIKKQARDEFDRLEKALAMSRDALTKERADSERFRKEKIDLERQLSEAKQRVTLVENESAQKDKRAAAG